MNILEFKRKLLDTGLFRKVSGEGQYVCKTCPYCGDAKNHFYVRISMDEEPVVCHCFKCNYGGLLNDKFLEYFNIERKVPFVKGRKRISNSNSVDVLKELLDLEKDTKTIQMCKEYLKHRLHVDCSNEELKAFQLIGNPVDYINTYLGGDCKGLNGRIWFRLNNGNIIGRSVDDQDEFRWKKRNNIRNNMGFGLYSIKTPVYLDKPINICICEGILDAIGLYYHGGIQNALYVACMGSNYAVGMKYALDMGVFGDGVNIRIYKDADIDSVRIPRKLSCLFHSCNVYRNTLAKDYGVPVDQLDIERCYIIK